MSDLNKVLEINQKLENLKRRLGELENERTAINTEIAVLMSQLGDLTGAYRRPSNGAPLREHILWVLNQNVGRGAMGPADIARELGLSGRDQGNATSILGRLVREGRVRRHAHGRYAIAGK